MSDDLVRRSDVMRVALWFGTSELKYSRQFVKRRVMEIPTAKPKYGEWIEHKERTIVRDNNFIDFFPTEYECSNCGLKQAIYFINSTLSNFCPNCGASMKGADDE